jgi:hypothetical protein
MQDCLPPMAQTLLHKSVHGIYLHPLGAPAKGSVRRRVTTPDDVSPKRLLRRRFEQIHIDAQPMLLGALAHLVQRSFHHFDNGRNLHAGVRAQDGDGLFAFVRWKREDSLEDERGQHRAVLPAAEPHKPRAIVLCVELVKRTFNVLVGSGAPSPVSVPL